MAEKVVRKRGYYHGRLVTVIKGKPGAKRGNVAIRDFGFLKEVPAKEVEPVKDDEPRATLKFVPADE